MKMDNGTVLSPLNWSTAQKDELSAEHKRALETALDQPAARFIVALTDLFGALPSWSEVAAWYGAWRTTQALEQLSDETLKDIGIEPSNVAAYTTVRSLDRVNDINEETFKHAA